MVVLSKKHYLRVEKSSVPRNKESDITPHISYHSITGFIWNRVDVI